MGTSQSCEACDLEKNKNTKSKSYVEELLHMKQAQFLNLNSIESKEVLQSRRERILRALTDRKPVKPYAVQLLEARGAAKSDLSIPNKAQESRVSGDSQSNNVQGQKKPKEPDQKSRILQRIAARRKSKRPINVRQSPPAKGITATTDQSMPVSILKTSSNKTGVMSAAVNVSSSSSFDVSPSPSINILTPLASNKATQSDLPVQVSVLSKASQSSFLRKSVDSAIQVTPSVQSCLQQTVRLSEPKIYIQPPPPPAQPLKILTPPPARLPSQPPLSVRQSISNAFSRSYPTSVVEPNKAPSPPSFTDLLENVCKEKLNQNKSSNWKPVLKEEKGRFCEKDPLPSIRSPVKSLSGQKLPKLREGQPLELDSDDSCRKRHTAAVDRLTDSLMANWVKKKTSEELLGSNGKELSLLTYSEPKRGVVPHFPVRREKSMTSRECINRRSVLTLKDSLPSVKFGRTQDSQLSCESRRDRRCMRHRDNKI